MPKGESPVKEPAGHILLITVVSAVLGTGLGGIIYAVFIYKGSEIRIFVVRKRTNVYQMYSRQYGSYNTEHYVVYAKYPDSDKIHTLACDGYIYRRLHENKGYNVTVRFLWIKKIHREKLRSKKKR